MGSNGRLILTLSGVAVLCAPRGFAPQHSPNVEVEKKAIYLAAGKGQKPFNVTRHSIPLGDIQSGGPPKDGIPALAHPLFTSAAEGDRALRQSDVVLGLEFDGIAKAYPLRILNWHEVANARMAWIKVVSSADAVGELPRLYAKRTRSAKGHSVTVPRSRPTIIATATSGPR